MLPVFPVVTFCQYNSGQRTKGPPPFGLPESPPKHPKIAQNRFQSSAKNVPKTASENDGVESNGRFRQTGSGTPRGSTRLIRIGLLMDPGRADDLGSLGVPPLAFQGPSRSNPKITQLFD